ncbi:MAG TPA: MFS transporter [Ktedonobacterales bacterium]|nr:MFS transporter [Ktedonobacterales bacterium]
MSDIPVHASAMSEDDETSPTVSRAAAWSQVITLSLTEITSWGILYYTFSVLLGPMEHDLHWNQASLTGAYSLALLVSGLMAAPIGRWLDRARTPRALMAAGSLLGVVALVVWATVTSLLVFYVLWIALGIAMAATLYEPAFTTVAAWFPRRERALTVLTTLGGFASVIYLPVAARLIEHMGWRMALLALAALLLLGAALPHALMLRPYPAGPHVASNRANVPVKSPWRAWRFWQLVAGFTLAQLAISALVVYLIPYLGKQGLSAPQAATASGLIGVTAFGGRIIATWRSTPATRASITAVLFLALALGIVVLTLAHGTVGLAVFIILFGAGFGVFSPARAGLVADRFGTAIFGRVNGQLALAITLARATGPTLVGVLLLHGTAYTTIFWLLAALVAVGAALLWLPTTRRQPGDSSATLAVSRLSPPSD